MMGKLSGLRKTTNAEIEEKAQSFISSAPSQSKQPATQPKVREKKFERHTFSLTQEASQAIDSLSCLPRTFRSSRSDVVKAGIEALKRMSEDEVIKLLEEVKNT